MHKWSNEQKWSSEFLIALISAEISSRLKILDSTDYDFAYTIAYTKS